MGIIQTKAEKRTSRYFGKSREKAAGASLTEKNTEPVSEPQAETAVSLAGFSRDREDAGFACVKVRETVISRI